MQDWLFDYVGGTYEGVRLGTHESMGVTISKLHNDYIWIFKKGHISIKIPWKNVVEIQHFTADPKKKTGKKWLIGAAIGAGIMLTPLGPIIAGAKLVAMGAATAGTLALTGITVGGGIGTIWGVRDKIMSKITKDNCFMITYLDENDPEYLQVLIFEHGNMFIKSAVQLFTELMEKNKETQKAEYVVAFQEKLAEAMANVEIVDDAEETESDVASKNATTTFMLEVDFVDEVSGKPFVSGKIGTGSISEGAEVEVVKSNGETKTYVVSLIAKGQKAVDYAKKGQSVSLRLDGLKKEDVAVGDIIRITETE